MMPPKIQSKTSKSHEGFRRTGPKNGVNTTPFGTMSMEFGTCEGMITIGFIVSMFADFFYSGNHTFFLYSRLGVLWLPINYIPECQTSPGLTIMLFAWCLTEIVRYSYYAFNLVNINVGIITWLRYTLFIVLYPMGVSGELWCYISSLPYLATSKFQRMELPNALNFTFSPYVITIMILLFYIPGFPPLYFHMFAQRKKVLGAGTTEEKSKKVA